MESITHGSNLKILALEKEIKELKALKKEKKEKYSHILQMLILDYLEIGKDIQDNNKRASIYAPIIGRDWETTRQYFSRLNYEKNKKNLAIIIDYFKKGGLNKQVQIVKEELDRLNKKKK